MASSQNFLKVFRKCSKYLKFKNLIFNAPITEDTVSCLEILKTKKPWSLVWEKRERERERK